MDKLSFLTRIWEVFVNLPIAVKSIVTVLLFGAIGLLLVFFPASCGTAKVSINQGDNSTNDVKVNARPSTSTSVSPVDSTYFSPSLF